MMSPRVLVIGQFAVVVALLAIGVLVAKFVGDGLSFLLTLVSTPLILGSALIVVAWAVRRPTRSNLLIALFAVLTVAGARPSAPLLARAGDRLFFESRRERLDDFTAEVLALSRIRSMSDGLRHFKELNGDLVAYTSSQVDTSRSIGIRPTLPLEQVLARDGISQENYDAFRSRLHDLKLTEFEVHTGFIAYLYDGTLDNLEGYLFVLDGREPPALQTEMFSAMLISLRPLGNGWYWFATT